MWRSSSSFHRLCVIRLQDIIFSQLACCSIIISIATETISYTSFTSSLSNLTSPPCRRKRGEKGEVVETIEDVIVRRLTAERIEELKRLIKDTQEKYRYVFTTFYLPLYICHSHVINVFCTFRKLKKEVDLIQAGHMDTKLEELWADIEL